MAVPCCNGEKKCLLSFVEEKEEEREWWNIIVVKNWISVICQNCVLMVWCYFMFWFLFFCFVDRNAQLKSAGEYYVKLFMKTICAIMCIKVCLHYMYLVCFQSGGGGEEGGVAVAAAVHCPGSLPGKEGGTSG